MFEKLYDFVKNQSYLHIFVLSGIPAGTPAGTPAAYRLRTGVAERVLGKVFRTWNLMGNCVKSNKGQKLINSSR